MQKCRKPAPATCSPVGMSEYPTSYNANGYVTAMSWMQAVYGVADCRERISYVIYKDHYYQAAGQLPRLGGHWDDVEMSAGLSFWALDNASSATFLLGFRGRLLKKPL